jgi:hypothetical protein
MSSSIPLPPLCCQRTGQLEAVQKEPDQSWKRLMQMQVVDTNGTAEPLPG